MNISELHRDAMELADQGFYYKNRGDSEASLQYFREALVKESKAAFAARQQDVGEPSESVLFRSAASLALNAQNYSEAERLVAYGLIGNPPNEIAEELRDIYENINFERHLQLNGIELNGTEVQMSISGKQVGFGFAKSDQVTKRINLFEKLTLRTAERKTGRPFRESGPVNKELKHAFEPYLSVGRAASFAFTVHFGVPTSQLQFLGTETPLGVVDDVLNNIALINEGREAELKETINDEAYFRNFFSLTKEMAPDGSDISLVGFTTIRDGHERRISFTRLKSQFNSDLLIDGKGIGIDKDEPKEFVGRLTSADSDESRFALKLESGVKLFVVVPEGLGDIVKNYFEEEVRIVGVFTGQNTVRLIDLNQE